MAIPASEFVKLNAPQKLDPIKGVKKLPLEEYFTSGHRTCQGCESALVMKMMVKAASHVLALPDLDGLYGFAEHGEVSLLVRRARTPRWRRKPSANTPRSTTRPPSTAPMTRLRRTGR